MNKKKRINPDLLGLIFKAHPWHGIPIGEHAPEIVTTFVEMVPTDTVKYELDKLSGYLKVDRPQRFSNLCPSIYGFIPQTFCGTRVGAYCKKKTGINDIVGDGDPLDICVLAEKPILHGNCLLQVRPIGGFRMIDNDEADDKIIAVLKNDAVYGSMKEIKDCPPSVIERLRHYFLTYKEIPGESPRHICRITDIYDRQEAYEVIKRSHEDYDERFDNLDELVKKAFKGILDI